MAVSNTRGRHAGATSFLATTSAKRILGHYGPGCFALLLPTAGLADAIGVAERLREGFAQYKSRDASSHRRR